MLQNIGVCGHISQKGYLFTFLNKREFFLTFFCLTLIFTNFALHDKKKSEKGCVKVNDYISRSRNLSMQHLCMVCCNVTGRIRGAASCGRLRCMCLGRRQGQHRSWQGVCRAGCQTRCVCAEGREIRRLSSGHSTHWAVRG